MNASATKGVWESTINGSTLMVIDTNVNKIYVKHEERNPVTFMYEGGITMKDIEEVRERIMKAFGINDSPHRRLQVDENTSIIYNPEKDVMDVFQNGYSLIITRAAEISHFISNTRKEHLSAKAIEKQV